MADKPQPNYTFWDLKKVKRKSFYGKFCAMCKTEIQKGESYYVSALIDKTILCINCSSKYLAED